MSKARGSINILMPNVCRFPELNAFGNNGIKRSKQQTELPAGDKETPLLVAAALEEEGNGNGRSLYVIDSKGNLLEHVRYQGNDYRYALRAAINTMPANPAFATAQHQIS